MSQPFLAEIRMFSYASAPQGWAPCDGRLLQIVENADLFSLLGAVYGGDGHTTFALPDMRGRTPVYKGSDTFSLGQKGGTETHVLALTEMPSHSHALTASSSSGNAITPEGNALGVKTGDEFAYTPSDPVNGTVSMRQNSITRSGSSVGHENMQPFLSIGFCIATQGEIPPKSISREGP